MKPYYNRQHRTNLFIVAISPLGEYSPYHKANLKIALCVPRFYMRSAVLFLLVNGITSAMLAQSVAAGVLNISAGQCVYRPGDDPAWAAASLDEIGPGLACFVEVDCQY